MYRLNELIDTLRRIFAELLDMLRAHPIISITVVLLLISAGVGYALLNDSSTIEPPPQDTSPEGIITTTPPPTTTTTTPPPTTTTTTPTPTTTTSTIPQPPPPMSTLPSPPPTLTPTPTTPPPTLTPTPTTPPPTPTTPPPTTTATPPPTTTTTPPTTTTTTTTTPPTTPASNFEQEIERLEETIANVAATGESSEVSLVFSEEVVNDEASQSLVGTTINAGVPMEVTAVNLDLQAGNLIVAEIKAKISSFFGTTIRVTAQVSIEAGKPVVEIIEANVPEDMIADAITQALDNMLIQLTQTGTADDDKVDIEFTGISIHEDELTLIVMVSPKA